MQTPSLLELEWFFMRVIMRVDPYSELFWSAFSRIQTEYVSVFCPNAGKCGPE